MNTQTPEETLPPIHQSLCRDPKAHPTKTGLGQSFEGRAPGRWIGFMGILVLGLAWLAPTLRTNAVEDAPASRLQKQWLFIWRDMNRPGEVERMIARFPRAATAGYNGVAFSYNIDPGKAAKLRQAAKQNGLDLVAIVMGGAHDRNYPEGVLVQDALFVAHDGAATLQPDNPSDCSMAISRRLPVIILKAGRCRMTKA